MARTTKKVGKKLKGLIIIHKDVGAMPPKRVKAYLKECGAELSDLINNLEATGYDMMWVPVRNQGTSVKVIKF